MLNWLLNRLGYYKSAYDHRMHGSWEEYMDNCLSDIDKDIECDLRNIDIAIIGKRHNVANYHHGHAAGLKLAKERLGYK